MSDAPTAAELFARIEARKKERAEKMPDTDAALRAIADAVDRLRELGWRDGIYAPKDGTIFETVSAGSTGIHKCSYSGQWADGYFMFQDGGDLYPTRSPPLMFRALRQ